MAIFLGVFALVPTAVLAMPTTANKHVDTYGGGAATVLVTANQFDGPKHLQDWYAGNHYNCFRKADMSAAWIQNKLNHGWTEVAWGDPYPSDTGLITIRGPYICKITPIGG